MSHDKQIFKKIDKKGGLTDDPMLLSPAHLKAANLKFILEELEFESFTMLGREISNFQWNGPLRIEKLSVEHADWLSFEAILNCECKYLSLGHQDLTAAQLNTFIKKWLDCRTWNTANFSALWNPRKRFFKEFRRYRGILEDMRTIRSIKDISDKPK